jgi:hypothetical protein
MLLKILLSMKLTFWYYAVVFDFTFHNTILPTLSIELETEVKKPSLTAIILGLIPFTAVCFTVSLWDRIEPVVLGLPFNMFWLILWIVITPLFMWGAYHAEVSKKTPGEEGER